MEAHSNSDTTIVKAESSTNDGSSPAGSERQNNSGRDRQGGSGGERFGRGGRFGGPRGGSRGGGGDRGNFENRRGRGGYQGRGIKHENTQDGQEGEGIRDGDYGRGGRADMGGRGRFGMRGPDDKLIERIQQLSGPTFDLPVIDMAEKKFNGRNRLYIGNIPSDVTEDDIVELFKPYGETSELFLNKDKNFGFVKLDYHSNAEKAKRELDGSVLKNRNLKIRFAPNSTTIKVKNLTPFVSNELLHHAFSVFGEIEKAIVTVDDRGKPTGEAIIDFSRKGSALHAIRKCSEGCYFLTGSLRPCVVEAHDVVDDIDGYPDKNIPKKNIDYHKEREQGPRFAKPGSFENEYGMRWKQLYDLFAQKQESLKKELELEKEKLEAQMEYAKFEHETEVLREQLRAREMDKDRQKREWEMKQRQVEEERLRTEVHMRRTQEDMASRILQQQQEDMRRRNQETNLFMQAHNLNSILDQQEQAYEAPTGYSHNSNAPTEIKDELDHVYEGSIPSFTTAEFKRGRMILGDDACSGRLKATTDDNIAKAHQNVLDDRRIKGELVPKKAKTVFSAGKVMTTITGAYFASLLDKPKAEFVEKWPHSLKKEILFHQDNASSHTSEVSLAKIHELRLELLGHPPFSLDLAPSDFFLFTHLKIALEEQKFLSND
nr:hrp65 protein-like [Leptinotarsa decemlineata]